MRRQIRIKARPQVEMLEGKALLAATIGGLHTFQTDSGATVTVERERFRRTGNQMTLNLQLNSGGQRFTEVYRLKARGGGRSALNQVSRADLINQFANDALAQFNGAASGGRSSFANTVTVGNTRFNQTVSIRTRPVRGHAAGAGTPITTSDAFTLLAQDLMIRNTAQPGFVAGGSQQVTGSGTGANSAVTSSFLGNRFNTAGSSNLAGNTTSLNTAQNTVGTNLGAFQTTQFGSSIFGPGLGSNGTTTGNGFQNLGGLATPNGVGFLFNGTPTVGSLNGTGTFSGTGSFTGTGNGTGILGTGLTTATTGTLNGTGSLTGTGNGAGLGNNGLATPLTGTFDGTGTLTGTGNGAGLVGIPTNVGMIDGTGTLTGTGNGAGLGNNGLISPANGTFDGTGTLTGTGNGTGIPLLNPTGITGLFF